MGKNINKVMKTEQEFKQSVIQVTLKSIDKKVSDWITFNDKINMKFVTDDYLSSKVELIFNELPIIECDLDDSYFLITTERIISIIEGSFDDVYFNDMNKLSYKYEAENYKQTNGKYPKINIIAVEKRDKKLLLIKVDSYYPAYFSKMLICNIFSYKTFGRWFIDPK